MAKPHPLMRKMVWWTESHFLGYTYFLCNSSYPGSSLSSMKKSLGMRLSVT